MSRPDLVVLVAGTGTEVGKTWVGAGLLRGLAAQGIDVHARKPAQSFDPGDDEAGITDAQILAAATGESPDAVCPPHRWYGVPMAPPMAAAALGRPPIALADLVAELRWPAAGPAPARPVVGVVETAGGVRSPLADDGDTVTLAGALRPDLVVVVADAGLGTVNAVLLTVAALAGQPVLVVLNRFDAADDLHERNRAWLAGALDGLDALDGPVLTATADLVALVAARARDRHVRDASR